MRTLVLLRANFKRTFIEMRRYYFETLSGLVTLFLFFLAVFYGARAFGAGNPDMGNTLEAIVVGYFMWSFAIISYSSQAQQMIQEAQVGTLEQLAMSPLGLPRVMVTDLIAGFSAQLIFMGVMLMAMMAASGKWLNLDLTSTLPVLLLSLAGISGLGFAAGGLAVVFKRVQSLLQIMQIGFLALVAVPIARFAFMKYLPLAWGNHLLNRVMVGGESLWTQPVGDIVFLVVHSLAYFFVGLWVFKYFERIARRRALLGHY